MPPMKYGVSESVFQLIHAALEAIAADPTLPRTKRQVEQLSSLSHATVARAFAEDAKSQSQWRITSRLETLVNHAGRRSEDASNVAALRLKLKAKNEAVRELERERDVYLQALYAYYLASNHDATSHGTVVPIGINKDRKTRGID
jgi:hypothetical protein